MNFDKFSALLDDFYSKPWKFRMKLLKKDSPTNWQSTAIWSPTDNYVENHGGLTSFFDIEHIEIDPILNNNQGSYISKKTNNKSYEVCDILKMHNVDYQMNEGLIRIKIQ